MSMHNLFFTFKKSVCAALLGGAVLLSAPFLSLPVQAETLTDDGHPYDEAAEAERLAEPVQSNTLQNWPQGPSCSAEGAIVMDMDTGAILYQKNIHEKLYPASTTKMLTCLIAAENLDLSDTVTFSEEAVNSVPADGSSIGMDVGESITVEECLYGILVGSANECANAIAEKTAGSIDAFVNMMNEKAEELGCTDSHFANANGLFLENHYTSPHDLALIASAFFKNETLLRIGNTPQCHFQATSTQPDDFWITNKHKLITGEVVCEGVMGGKTGYTDEAKECLVTGCQRNGMRLVCVVMKEDSPKQFTDTVTLFDYGFSNFSHVSPAESDTSYTLKTADFLTEGTDLFGTATPLFSISEDSTVTLPDSITFDEVTSSIDDSSVITYTYGEGDSAVTLGTAQLLKNDASGDGSAVKTPSLLSRVLGLFLVSGISGTLFVNVPNVLLLVLAVGGTLIVIFEIRALQRYRKSHRGRGRRGRRATPLPKSAGPRRGYELPEEFGRHYYD